MSEDTVDAELDGDVTTVNELNTDISSVISRERNNTLDFDYLVGDVSDDSTANGTRYFQLVNDDAGIQCLVFSNTRRDTPEFDEGDRVAVKGKLTFYEARSNCSVYVDSVVPIGESKYHAEIQRIKEKLSEEGLFDDELKQQIPSYPTGVGIVTSKDSDAEEDAIKSIHERHPDVDIYLYDTNVQGMSALEDLCEGIAHLDAHPRVQTVIVTRGGGSEQDLHVFNSEGVSRMIVDSETPVITAIGHENDEPICDFVADGRAMTPTDIGGTVVPSKDEMVRRNEEFESELVKRYVDFTDEKTRELQRSLDASYESHCSEQLNSISDDFSTAYNSYVESEITDLENRLSNQYELFMKEKDHEKDKADLERKTTQYKYAVAVLLVLLIIIALFVIL